MREFFRLTDAEAVRLRVGLTARKWGFEVRWEAEALLPMVVGLALAFMHGAGWGFIYLWVSKFALQGMIQKGFFDSTP